MLYPKTEGSNHGREKMVKKMMIKSQKSNEQNDSSLLENTKIIPLWNVNPLAEIVNFNYRL